MPGSLPPSEVVTRYKKPLWLTGRGYPNHEYNPGNPALTAYLLEHYQTLVQLNRACNTIRRFHEQGNGVPETIFWKIIDDCWRFYSRQREREELKKYELEVPTQLAS